MNLRRALLLFTLWTMAAVRLSAIYVWFTSAPSPVESGQGYYVEAYSFSYNESGVSLSLYKNGGWFASGGGWSDAVAGGWTSDAGPQTVSYMAEAYDPYEGGVWDWASVTVNGTPPPANNPPNAWVEVDGYGHTATVTRPYGGTINITVRYKAGDPDGNLARIRPQVWHPGTGLFTNDGGGWTGQAGGYGEVVRTVTLDRNGDWYFWTDAEDTNNVFVNSGAWGDAFRLTVIEGAPPNVPPVITLLSPAAQTITVGTALTLSSHATDANGNLTHHHLDIQRPDGSWNWQGGFANGEPYNGGPVGSAADSTRTAVFTFDQAGTWHVRSWANDSAGANLHSATVAITVNPAAAPGVPQNLAVSGLTSSSFALSWTNPGGATGYEVRLNGGTPVAVSGLSYTFSSLAAGASYSAEVRAGGAGGWSGWVGAGATTGGSGGGTVAGSSVWRDVDGDGILDEIVRSNTAEFDYYVNQWSTENFNYWSLPINNYWFGWSVFWTDGLSSPDFSTTWLFQPYFWIGYETYFELVFEFSLVAHEPFRIYRDTSGSHNVNPATWELIVDSPLGSSVSGWSLVRYPLPGPNDLPGVQYFLVKKGLPVGTAQLTDTFGVSLGSAIPGSVLNVLLPGNNHLVVTARDLLGRVLTVGHNGVVFSVRNALGQLLNLPNNGLLDVLDIGIDQTGTWQIGAKLGGQSDAQTIWFNVNVQPAQISILNKDRLPLTQMKVAKLTQSGVIDYDINNLNPDADPDRFYIRVIDPAKRGTHPKMLVWTESPDFLYSDSHTLNPSRNQVELEDDPENSTALISKAMILMSDSVDDVKQVGFIADNALNDRTRIVALGGKLHAEYLAYKANPTYVPDVEAIVPVRKTVNLNVVILRDLPLAQGGLPATGPTDEAARNSVLGDLRIAQERYAQVGIKLTWGTIEIKDPPPGVNLTDTLGLEVEGNTTSTMQKVHPEARALIEAHGTISSNLDIHVFYVPQITAVGELVYGYALTDEHFNPTEDNYIYNTFVAATRNVFTLPHEVTHLVADSGHVVINYADEGQYWINLLRNGTSENTFLGSKRLTVEQETKIFANPRVQNFP